MMPASVWAIGSDAPVKFLALAGAVAVGAFVVGWLVQLAASAFGQKVPGVVLNLVRAGAGVGCGVIAYFWLFGAGGGFGGGGWGLGRGSGKGEGTGSEKLSSTKGDSTGKQATGSGEGRAGETLTVEVLGDDPLQRMAQKQGGTANLYRRYRAVKGGKKELLTFDEVKALIEDRRGAGGPPLRRVVVVVYQDSPSDDQGWITRLQDFARGLDKPVNPLQVSLTSPGENAPLD